MCIYLYLYTCTIYKMQQQLRTVFCLYSTCTRIRIAEYAFLMHIYMYKQLYWS